jgi:hypothetical protein
MKFNQRRELCSKWLEPSKWFGSLIQGRRLNETLLGPNDLNGAKRLND